MIDWQPIETAPKDGSKFIVLIGNAIYAAYYDEVGRFCWIMHSNKAEGRSYQKKIIDGVEYQLELKPEGKTDYQPQAFLWRNGFEDKPSHWMSLPKPPTSNNN